MSKRFCKAQMFSTDFLIACSIFLLAITVVMIYWSYTNLQIEETKTINDMIDKAYTISDIWFREGTPKYWNSTNVNEIGLLSDHKINETKMNEMKNIGYNKVKEKIGAAPYEFRFKVLLVGDTPFTEPVAYLNGMPESDLTLIDQLNNSNLVWDFYMGDDNVQPYHYVTASAVHGDGIPNDEQNLMKDIISNIDSYKSIILEHTNQLGNGSFLTLSETNKLKKWINISGNSLFVINNPDFLNIIGWNPYLWWSTAGNVSSTDEIFNASINNTIQFKISTSKIFRNSFFPGPLPPLYPMRTMMNIPSPPPPAPQLTFFCIFCRWWVGDGNVYYIADTTKSDGTPIQEIKPFGYNFIFGKYPTQSSNIIKVERAGILNSSIAIIEVLLWK